MLLQFSSFRVNYICSSLSRLELVQKLLQILTGLPVAEKCEFSRSLDKAIFFAKKGVVFCNLDSPTFVICKGALVVVSSAVRYVIQSPPFFCSSTHLHFFCLFVVTVKFEIDEVSIFLHTKHQVCNFTTKEKNKA